MAEPTFDELTLDDLMEMDADQAVHTLIHQAGVMNASDLFFHSNERNTEIAIRRLGTFERLLMLPRERGRQLISSIKALAGMDISEHRRPLDGRVIYEVGDREFDLRLNSLPTLYGEDMTIRIWDRSAGLRQLDELGMSRNELNTVTGMLNQPSGLLLVTGPTGTGKTTTLYACMDYLNNGERKISTLEDPVEFVLPGVRQAQVNPKISLDFPELLRSVLRQAPDVILVGEIRDRDTAATAVRAANSGHLVLATLHAPVASGAVQSLLQLGCHPYFLSSCLLGIVAQRLVRSLCEECRIAYDMTDSPQTFSEIRPLLEDGEGDVIYGPVGCDQCFNIGYSSRTGLFEIMTMTKGIRKLIAEGSTTHDLQAAAIEGDMVELRRSALIKVAQGKTSMEEILKDVPPEFLGLED